MEVKKRKLSETAPHFECCVCGESGSNGFTNIYNISLREKDDFLISFVEVVSFVLGIEVLRESSDICISCKPKIIEYYHFKKRSQAIQKKVSPLIQEIMKIVNNYITKNDIKAITIEESREKLVLMEKTPEETSQEFLDIEIKREPESNPVIREQVLDTSNEPEVTIKEETENVAIKQEPIDNDENSTHQKSNEDDFQEPSTSDEARQSPTQSVDNPDSKLDQILKLNQEIFTMISSLDQKFDDFKGICQRPGAVPYVLNQDAIRPLRK